MNEEEICTTCGQMYWSAYVKLPADERAKTSACPGHYSKPELVTLPPGTQIFPDNYEALWEIVQVVAQEDSTYYDDNDARAYCPFCPAQKELPPYDVTHKPDCIVTKARTLIEQRKLQPRVEFKFHTEPEDAMIVTSVLHWKELMRGKWDKEAIDVTCEQCGERYHGPLEDMRGWYEFVEQEPRRNRYAFCSEGHMKQWKADRGVQW